MQATATHVRGAERAMKPTPNARRPFPTWALMLLFGSLLAAGVWQLVVALTTPVDEPNWAHVLHIVTSAGVALSSALALNLVLLGHHRRVGASPNIEGVSEAGEHEVENARAVVRTFPLTCTSLVLSWAVTMWVSILPDVPAFVRVISGTAALITFLWLAGALSSRRRAGSRLRRSRRDAA